jgi:hypothetical protein
MNSKSVKIYHSKLNRDITNSNKLLHIYYAHSLDLYFTEIEKKDLKYLTSKKFKVVNPRDLNLGKEMIRYLYKVKDCDAVWYRGNSIGVIFEILTALTLRKPVYSLESKKKMSKDEMLNFINTFQNNRYVDNDLFTFEYFFPDYYDDFIKMLNGDML